MKNVSFSVCAIALLGPLAGWARADALNDALEAPGLVFTASNASGPVPAAVASPAHDGVDAVRIGAEGEPQLRTTVTGPATLYYRARIDYPFNHNMGTLGQSGLVIDADPPGPWQELSFGAAEVVPAYYQWQNQTSPWVLLKAGIPAGPHTVTWWGRNYGGGGLEVMGFWIDRVVLSNAVTAPLFTNTFLPPAVIGRAYSASLPVLGTGLGFSSTPLPQGLTLSPAGVISGTPAGPMPQTLTLSATAANVHGSDTALMALPVLTPAEPFIDDSQRVWQFGGNSQYHWQQADADNGLDRMDCLAAEYYSPAGAVQWIATTGPGPDTLRFAFAATSQLQVLVDGAVVWSAPYASSPALASVAVPAGAHELRIQHTSTSGFSYSVLDMVSFDSDGRPMLYETAAIQYGQQGSAMSVPLPTTNPATLTVTGLPAGLSYSAAEQRITGTPAATGEFDVQVTATNARGSSERRLFLSIIPSISGVLDSPGLEWERITGPYSPQVFTVALNGVGGSSLTCSGALAKVETTLTGPDEVVFAVTSSSGTGGLRVLVDGHEVAYMTGVYDWRDEGISIPAGQHRLTFFSDYGSLQLDNVRRLSTRGAQPLLYGSRRILLPPGAANVPLSAAGAGTFSLSGGSLPPGAVLDASAGRITGTVSAGPRREATITLTNAAGSHTRTFTVFVMDSIPAALAPGSGLNFLLSSGAWDGMAWGIAQQLTLPAHQSALSRDGLSMGRTGTASPIVYSLLLTGPDTLTFDWYSNSIAGVRFRFDGAEAATEFVNEHPLATWQTRTVPIPAGTHMARWEFESGASTTGLLDRIHLASSGKPRIAGPHLRHFTLGQAVNENLNPGAGTVTFAGALPAGLALDAGGQLTGTPTTEGIAPVTLTLTSPAGADSARFEFVTVPPLAETVGQPALSFTTGGTGSGAAGFYSQRRATHTGATLLTPPLNGASDSAWLETTVTGPAQVTWWESIPFGGEGTRQFLHNGTAVTPTRLSLVSGWWEYTIELPGGSHRLRWHATGSDLSGAVYEAGLDTLTILPYGAPALTSSAALRYQIGEVILQTFTFSPTLITVTVADLPSWLTWNDGLRQLTGTAPLSPGTFNFTLRAANSAGATTIPVTVEITPSYRQALNAPQLEWDVSGTSAAPWFVQSTVSRDGFALQSGAVPHNEKSTLRTRITGPGTLSFWWKCSAAPGDEFDFRVDFDTLAELTGEADWRFHSYELPAGVHDVHFRYEKDAAGTAGADAAWLDQVSFTPTAYAAWIALRRTTLTAASDDPDGDGLVNLVEYALQTDPGLANPSPLPLPVMAGGQFTWDIPKPAGAPGLTWDIEVSATLASAWQSAGPGIVENSATRLRLALPASSARQFVRLRLSVR